MWNHAGFNGSSRLIRFFRSIGSPFLTRPRRAGRRAANWISNNTDMEQ
jgi:hypothetical protein